MSKNKQKTNAASETELKCPKCGSEKLFYYESLERKTEISDDLSLHEVDIYAKDSGDVEKDANIECGECYATSADNKKLAKLRDKVLKKNGSYNWNN